MTTAIVLAAITSRIKTAIPIAVGGAMCGAGIAIALQRNKKETS
ncbi:MAG: hypothetical protein PUP93_28620 [Rhizonema sp. NSF051]|nr:hypothetical protein [Rhizonema sp. NSF051]